MSDLRRCVSALLGSVLAALIGFGVASPTAATADSSVPAGQHAAEYGSHGSLACPETTGTTLTCAYDTTVPPESVASFAPQVGTAILDGSEGDKGAPLSPERSGVATNSALRTPSVLRVGEVKLSAVPEGVTGTSVQTGKGLEYAIPRGTPELDPRVTSIRIMDPVTSGKYQYPNGYAAYMNRSGQTVNPITGETIAPSHPFAHILLP